MTEQAQMKAVVTERAGGPEMLELRQVPRPEPRPGWVLIRVRAFGLNRSELKGQSRGFTRHTMIGGIRDVRF